MIVNNYSLTVCVHTLHTCVMRVSVVEVQNNFSLVSGLKEVRSNFDLGKKKKGSLVKKERDFFKQKRLRDRIPNESAIIVVKKRS